MTKTRITIKSPKGLELLKKSFYELTDNVGLEVKKTARETAPRSEGEKNSAHYKDRINYYSNSKTVIAEQKYSAAIEYGFDNYDEEVREHERVIKKAFGKNLNPPVIATVKAHTRTMNRKPNPVMRNAAKVVQGQVKEIWKKTLKSNGL